MPADIAFVVSCEHATCRVPKAWRHLFPDSTLLHSHRGWDPGAATVARALGRRLDAPVILGRVTRLLADANRSAHHAHVHGEAVRRLSEPERRTILATWHAPHQRAVCNAVQAGLAQAQRVVHISCHSFTAVLDGETRTTDIGLLYDPRHGLERTLARSWQRALAAAGTLRTRRNYPYRGRDDGMTRICRRRFGTAYLGLELELNQALLIGDGFPSTLPALLHRSLVDAVADLPRGA